MLQETLGNEGFNRLLAAKERLAPSTGGGGQGTPSVTDPTPLPPATKEWLRKVGFWAATAYCLPDQVITQQCGRRCSGPTAGTQTIRYFATTDTDTVGYVGVQAEGAPGNPVPLTIVVSFRGSESLDNWVENLEFNLTLVPWEPLDQEAGSPRPMVHKGFLASYLSAQEIVVSTVEALRKQYPMAPVVVTGHSLGAALAILCATDLKDRWGEAVQVHLISFEAPRVGNPEFVQWFVSLFAHQQPELTRPLRVTHGCDPVPRLPIYDMGFTHGPREVYISWRTDQSTVLCDPINGEDPNCSDSLWMPLDIFQHLYTWDVIYGSPCES